MKAQSEVYIRLQNIYKAKARQDVDEVLKIVRAASGHEHVDTEEVELFCKNAAFVKLINARGGEDNSSSVDRLVKIVCESMCGDHSARLLSPPPPPRSLRGISSCLCEA
jgi:amyloid beta precursor protein binding protein 1